jgi:UDPglucose--hexose-1-phosphate uridylyltransferase
MAHYVPDVKTRRWVVIAPRRRRRPDDHQEEKRGKQARSKDHLERRNGFAYDSDCPFCFGNEKRTPPEIYRWGRSYPTDTNWIVRVVPNKYPITDIHEVIIHSPDHLKDIADFAPEHVEIILKVYRERYNTLSAFGNVIIFNNKGKEAGESLTHPHSQVVVIPQQIKLDALLLEPVNNLIEESDQFVVFCPDFSQWPYEVWIAPRECAAVGHKRDGHQFGNISDSEISNLALLLINTLKRLRLRFPRLAYNYYIYPYGCWYLRIIPRNVIIRAGFEHGTGIHVNTVSPAEAAKELRDGKESRPREMVIERGAA